MNSTSCIGLSTMKPCCRLLIGCRNSSIFAIRNFHDSSVDNFSKSRYKLHDLRGFHDCSSKILGFRCVIDPNRKVFCGSGSNWGQARVFTSVCPNRSGRCISVIANVASDYRSHSTSVEAHVSEKSFDRIYVQGGLNVKPLVIERIERGSDVAIAEKEDNRVEVNGSNVNISEGLNDSKFFTSDREVSGVEKEAWDLLRSVVVDYCGNPVGTVAASDPADKQPLNYDQVFIRDFVPSALAFLLNGEGEIVKNFLLHTLQLQVVIDILA